MSNRSSTRAVAAALAAALMMAGGSIAAAADAKHPNWRGQWIPVNTAGMVAGQTATFDPSKSEGPGQQAPLTSEYQKVLEGSLADQANGGLGNDPTAQCYAAGMPRMMTYEAQEYVITVFDKALTRPWTVDKTFRRNPDPRPEWPESYCHVTNKWLVLGGEAYLLDEQGILMPTRKDQPPPDLQFFKPPTR